MIGEKNMSKEYECAKCGNTSFETKKIAATGTGLSKLFDIQHNKFGLIICTKCGFVEMYDLKRGSKRLDGMDILDIFVGD
jgi:predicted nucleic-acid-binding Zn-ribbon protein